MADLFLVSVVGFVSSFIDFEVVEPGGGGGPAVPEPGAAALYFVGLGVVLAAMRRRNES